MKRYIYIILGIIVAAIIAILILFFLKGGSALSGILPAGITGSLPSVGTQGSNSSTGTSDVSGFGSSTTSGANSSTTQSGLAPSFNMVSNIPIVDYFVDTQGNITAVQPSGEVVTISGSQPSTISSSSIYNIISTGFSYDGKKLLVGFGNQSDPQSAVLDIASQKWTGLPMGLRSPQWSPSNYQLAFFEDYGAGATALDTINVASVGKLGATTLLSLNADDLSLQWISKTQFILSDKSSIQTPDSSWLFNSQNKTLEPIIYEAPGLETIWGGSTTTIGLAFFQDPSGRGSDLQLVDANGNDLHDLNFLTLPTKCLFNQETSTIASAVATSTSTTTTAPAKTAPLAIVATTFLYCGVPSNTSQFSSAQLPDDYNDGAIFTSDEIIKLDTNTGDLTTLWNDPTQNIDATDLKIFNNTLYFINRYDNKLYSLKLAQ